MKPAVWAPRPALVELVVGGDSRPMEAGVGGWWHADADLPPGSRYGFSLDGGPPRPDPRSRHQPDGVHDLSAIVEVDRPPPNRRTVDLSEAVLYELHIGTFSPEGTFAGAIERLDHLVALGIDAVEVMPINQFSGMRGWGYDGVNLFAVHNAYGGPDGFGAFVTASHARGLGVVLDVVYNHLGPVGNYLGEFGPYFTDAYQTPWGSAVNLDGPDSDEVRRFFIDNARMWFEDFGLDGVRIDAVHELIDRSAVPFLEQLSLEVDTLEASLGRRLWLIAESDLNDPRLVTERDRGGYEIEAAWSDDFHHALHAVLTGEDQGYYADFGGLDDLATALEAVYVYAGRYSTARRRSHGRPVEDLPATRFIGYAQNHDQAGNRAEGERLGHLVEPGYLFIAAAVVLTAPFVPMLFQGEEWATTTPFPYFSDHTDPEVAEAVRQGRRDEFAAFGWTEVPDPQDPATFDRAKLAWEELHEPPHADVLAWYRALIYLRHERPDLTDGRPAEVDADEESRTVVIRRGRIVVAANLGAEQRRVRTPGGDIDLPAPGVAVTELVAT